MTPRRVFQSRRGTRTPASVRAQPPVNGAVYSGKEAVTRFWQDFFRESPQAHIEIEEIFGLGLRCMMRWRYDWVDAAGKKGHVRGVDLFKLKDGSICEKLSYVKG
ncbi:MAG: hypothetical protein COS37_06740 [Anaerolineae bacterium CG03_land_8_20_14_0_80_58_20]|nr:MAG: hypothetical protein COS37_06740 [Anaerolineae bacterium CG03_land_8_20_14_0_80_58_20]